MMDYRDHAIDQLHYMAERIEALTLQGRHQDAQALVEEAEPLAAEIREFTPTI